VPIATAVKLSRALWIAPIAIAAGRWHRREGGAPIPWFIVAFLGAAALRSAVPAIAPAAAVLGIAAKSGLAIVLAWIGAGLSVPALRAVGIRPFAQGLILWAFIAALALAPVSLGMF
jgi:uncharacterized membrane protein YadS